MEGGRQQPTIEPVSLEALQAAVQSMFALQNIDIPVDEQRIVAKTLMRLAPSRLTDALDK